MTIGEKLPGLNGLRGLAALGVTLTSLVGETETGGEHQLRLPI